MNTLNLFPTAVSLFDYEGLSKKEIEFLKKQKIRDNTGNKTSVDNYILNNKELKKLKRFIENCVNQYFKLIYQPKNNVSPYITQSWCNYTKEGEFHHKHAHPNSFISGVFYVQADKEKDRIYFFKEKYEGIVVTPKIYNSYNSESWWVPINTNNLVIFPSSLPHMVGQVTGEERISLSFNTFFKGEIGSSTELTNLSL